MATAFKAILAFKNAAKATPIIIRGLLSPCLPAICYFFLFFIYFKFKSEEIRESFDGKRVVSQNKTTYANASWIQSV